MSDVARQLVSAARDAWFETDYRRAIYLCKQAIEQDPMLLDAHSMLKAYQNDLVIDELVLAHDAATPAEARSICDELLEHVPENADVIFTRGLFQETSEDTAADFELVLQLEAEATDAEAIERRAEALDLLGKLEKAETAWTQLIDLDSENVDAWNGRAMNRLSARKIDAAVEDLQRALQLEPQNARALAQLAEAEFLNGKFEEVLKQASVARTAGYEGAYLDIVEAEALVMLDRYEEALHKLKAHVESGALDADEMVTYACALTEAGNPSEAISIIQEQISREEPVGDWHSGLAHALCAAGRFDEAKQHLDVALNLTRREFETKEFDSLYGIASCLAHRADRAEKHSLPGIDFEAERAEAAKLLKKAIDADEVVLRFAKAEREFDSFWSRPELSDYA